MTALIIDDERPARIELRRLLSAHPEIKIIGEAADIESALKLIMEVRPELIFLDIQMPGGLGFDLIPDLPAPLPGIIFTTAFDRHALRAFEVNAIDYLLKPIEETRLAKALARVVSRESPPEINTPLQLDDQVFLKSDDRTWFIRVSSIILLESVGNHTRVRFDNQQPLIHRSLTALEERLPAEAFMRANRSQIVNLHAIRSITPWFSGNLKATLTNGEEVEFSRRQSQILRELRGL